MARFDPEWMTETVAEPERDPDAGTDHENEPDGEGRSLLRWRNR
jgi:hypothetical protein